MARSQMAALLRQNNTHARASNSRGENLCTPAWGCAPCPGGPIGGAARDRGEEGGRGRGNPARTGHRGVLVPGRRACYADYALGFCHVFWRSPLFMEPWPVVMMIMYLAAADIVILPPHFHVRTLRPRPGVRWRCWKSCKWVPCGTHFLSSPFSLNSPGASPGA